MILFSTHQTRNVQRLIAVLMIATLLCLAQTANAQLRIHESVIEMHEDEASRVVEFQNTGEHSVFITLDLQQVISPATSRPDNEITVPANDSLVHITPAVLEIPAHQTAQATVHRTHRKIDTDEVYRLWVKPVRDANSAAIFLNYDLLLLVRPEKSAPRIAMRRTSSGVSLVNVGNSNAFMRSMQLCDRSIDACEPITSQRLYAKERWSVPVPKNFSLNHLVLHTEQTHQEKSQFVEYRTAKR